MRRKFFRPTLTAMSVSLLTVATMAVFVPPAAADTPGQELAALTVKPNGPLTGYSRDKFPHWHIVSGTCDTREEVLKRDGTNVTVGSNCYPTAGSWTSPYDGATWTKPSDVDIDHMVPLADSWMTGASTWTTAKREAFANDLTRPQLLAVTDNVNQSKGDRSPDVWKPPLQSYWCTYATRWVEVKFYYQLSVTSAEKSALSSMLGRC
ncbi:HNH endonuclease family protein [Fodinicola feengrottensis]|uniref:HNH endonuclease family protein n=1 Tax=Fodinicola feengrottensis TaxID=435914 RepID=A0ABP4RT42_9ACTN|nr:HNH endonuclease family protein [Fodinicola feengrottensis]